MRLSTLVKTPGQVECSNFKLLAGMSNLMGHWISFTLQRKSTFLAGRSSADTYAQQLVQVGVIDRVPIDRQPCIWHRPRTRQLLSPSRHVRSGLRSHVSGLDRPSK